ncbi:hypothetical protein FQN49_004969 [Arthroderma sp. PD_2]|nr:hypothetical protein FQN49_004969 [Arthroderma sp. PD_2]
MSSSDPLPAILCLHGAGTNAAIFQLQAHMIVERLKGRFRFIFLDAPFESSPGPGVLSTYGDLKPYLWWHCDATATKQFDIDMEEVQRRRQKVRDLLVFHLEKDNIVGVMSFSQGTRVATGLCLDDELGGQIKFAILISATFPELPVGENCQHRCLRIPSVHVQGLSDPWAAEGTRLRVTYYDSDQATVVQFAGGHTVPMARRDVDRVIKAISQAWDNACSQSDS